LGDWALGSPVFAGFGHGRDQKRKTNTSASCGRFSQFGDGAPPRHAASYACLSQVSNSLSTSLGCDKRTRWLTIALKLPEASSRPAGSVPFKLIPTSRRVAVEGWMMPNCLLRRRLT